MLFAIYGLIILSAGLIVASILSSPAYATRRLTLPDAEEKVQKVRLHNFLTKIIPFSRQILEKLHLDLDLKNKLDAAHLRFTAIEFFNLKIILMAVLCVAAYFVLAKPQIWEFALALMLGYMIPDIIVKRKIAQRKYAIARLLPETVDLLGLCVEAGLDFTTAVKWVIDKTPMNPMMEELAFVLEEIKWGKSRSQALKDMSKRLNIPEVSSFVQTLVLAERMGTPVAEAFMILSEDTRMMRFHRGERFALQAPIKILIPLIFCILPVIGIVIGAPILLEFMKGAAFVIGGK
ncbi:MAG: type II secretion system F family protein [Candidatus Omnitrophica bacterium]|nr:type II secretion system F family protein [Candidatus Omnitrophota bacterium]